MSDESRLPADPATSTPSPTDPFAQAEMIGRKAAEIEQADREKREPILTALHPDGFSWANMPDHLLDACRAIREQKLEEDHARHLDALKKGALKELVREVWAAAASGDRERITATIDQAKKFHMLEELFDSIHDVAWQAYEVWGQKNPKPDALAAAAKELGVPERLAELREDPHTRRVMSDARQEGCRPPAAAPTPPAAPPADGCDVGGQVLPLTPAQAEYLTPLRDAGRPLSRDKIVEAVNRVRKRKAKKGTPPKFITPNDVTKCFAPLKASGLVKPNEQHRFAITPAGRDALAAHENQAAGG